MRHDNKHKRIAIFLNMFIMLGLSSIAYAQQPNQGDCLGAQPVCDWIYNVPQIPGGEGNILNEINPVFSCLSAGEENGQWYIFTAQTSGMLNFNIIPYDPLDDYDWAVFNLTNAECGDIYNNPSLQVACNFSGSTANNGITGANGGSGDYDEPEVPVQAGQRFALYVSNYENISAGYSLDFSNSSAQIPDNVPPVLQSVVPSVPCNATQLYVAFSENVLCNTVQASDFQLVGPGGPYTVTFVSSAECIQGAKYSDEFTLSISPMISGGNFALKVVGSIVDICGNALVLGNPDFTFNYDALSLSTTVIDADCGVDNGQATVFVNGGTAPYQYLWNDPAAQATQTATNLARGKYTIQVTDAMGCKSIMEVIVKDPTNFTLDFIFQEDTCSKGVGSVRVQVNGTTPPYIYQFSGYGGINQNGPSNSCGSLTGDSLYYIRVTDVDGCYLDTLIPVPNYYNEDLHAYFTGDMEVNFLYPYAMLFNQSENHTSVLWLVNDSTQTSNVITAEFNDIGFFPVSLVAFDVNGCRDTFTALINVYYELSVYIPDAFTPNNNDNLNDRFLVKGVGIDDKTFEMMIYDRWGKVIFTSRDINSGWDGKINGQTLDDSENGVYAYKLNFNELNGKPHSMSGRVIVIK